MSDLRPDGTPYPADEDSPFGRWLSVYLTRIGACHDGYFDCANLKDAYLAGMDGDCGESSQGGGHERNAEAAKQDYLQERGSPWPRPMEGHSK